MPSSESIFTNGNDDGLKELLENIAGFAIVEKATMQCAPAVRSSFDVWFYPHSQVSCCPLTHGQVEEMWDQMCETAIRIISKSLHEVNDPQLLFAIKEDIALFMQTMEVRLSVI